MKRITVKTIFDEVGEYLMIDTPETLSEYNALLEQTTTDKISSVLASKVAPDRWDHMCGDSLGGSLLAAGWSQAYVEGNSNPLLNMVAHALQNTSVFTTAIANGETILVNDKGGYCYYDPNYHTIIDSSDNITPTNYFIPKNTKYINLENDAELELKAIKYLDDVDPNYSYITHLASFDIPQLIEIFTLFKQAGGEVVYVYTTGINVSQMFDYTEAAISAGLLRFEFEFNAGMDDAIQEFLDDFDSNTAISLDWKR